MVPHMSMWMLFGLATSPLADAHMRIRIPEPYGLVEVGDSLRSPISMDGSFPCHNKFDFSGEIPKMAVGEDQPLVFYPQIGEIVGDPAVHGGGTCQLSITLDVPPTSQSTFKVIKTIEGGCPGLTGSDGHTTIAVNNFTYQIPKIVPDGKSVLVWTWFPVFSEDPEMYMNCAPIEVSGGAQDTTAFNQLPDMLVANYDVKAINALYDQEGAYPASGPCAKPEGNNLMYVPDPGEVLERWESEDYTTVTATGQCGKTASGGAATVGSASAEFSTTQPLVTSTPVVVAGEPVAAGGEFIEIAATLSEAAAEAPSTTFATTTVAPPQSSDNAVAAANQASTPASAIPTNGSDNSQCTGSNNGQLVCNGTTHFGICNWGKVVWQSVADGTICENGTIKAANNVRAVAGVKVKRAHGYAHERLSPVGRQFHA